MAFERVCSLDEVAADQGLAVTLGRYEIVVARNGDEVFALENECSHASVALSEGEVADCQIECWLHGSMFDLRTGKPTTLPAFEPVAVYPVRVDGDDVLVDVHTPLNGP
jgi:3-phenylpropionate/trans-cinnamate dioxygenase ferredoxin subunit